MPYDLYSAYNWEHRETDQKSPRSKSTEEATTASRRRKGVRDLPSMAWISAMSLCAALPSPSFFCSSSLMLLAKASGTLIAADSQ